MKHVINGFNSIVVRLKVDKVDMPEKKKDPFQFHSGSIKSHDRSRRACVHA